MKFEPSSPSQLHWQTPPSRRVPGSRVTTPLNLEKTVKHLTMGQDRNTLHHLNSLHLHLHLTYGELLKERQSLLNSLHPHTSPQRAANRGALCCEEKHGDTVSTGGGSGNEEMCSASIHTNGVIGEISIKQSFY
ncbi:hypothetical protein AALO_G00073450 [Alosa alosa]|uniref:Uncharacterized protein n=1 Tax=Alosa alosa TaxID=278164 RepID=A0AAV6H2I3_9TELE|nr:hypothetical protein AALO_G00073450 [Alosa alosa]